MIGILIAVLLAALLIVSLMQLAPSAEALRSRPFLALARAGFAAVRVNFAADAPAADPGVSVLAPMSDTHARRHAPRNGRPHRTPRRSRTRGRGGEGH